MSVITARGLKAGENANEIKSYDLAKSFIHLKDGQSIKVRIFTPNDFVEYMAHSLYNLRIFTQPCIKPTGERCAFCGAAKAEIKEFESLKARPRYLFAFGVLQENAIKVFDASKGQAVRLIDTIKDYDEDLHEVVFLFKRTGNSLDTKYTLSPILKPSSEDLKAFSFFNHHKVEDSLFDAVLPPKTYEEQCTDLKNAGFPFTS